ncbi:MAG: DNA primase [Candidatus Staskawiczbacteria bacterium]|jgi:DNA primase
MFDSQIEEIKNKVNIVDVIGSYIKLKKAGANYRGVCPFHSEKSPSFFVSPVRQIWHCFGCGLGHSVFDFVMKIEGVEFGDALRILAQRAGVELKHQNPELRTARQRLYEICELATLFFEKQLEASVTGQKSKEYLSKRGINQDSIKKWRLGYAPESWQGLTDFLVGKGYERKEIETAGLCIKSEKNDTYYDRFRSRIMFPVFDLNSQIIGFGGRVTEEKSKDEVAKYINTPQTPLYDKSRVLYGLNNAKVEIRKKNQTILTEGYTDVIMSHQAGFENTVAASGTALTSPHLEILKRYSENLLLSFDMDIAGDSATKRGIDLAQEQGFNIKIIKQSAAGSDPADVIAENPANWGKAIAGARSILDYYFDSALASYDKSAPEGRKAIGKVILPIIKRIPNAIEQYSWLQKLSATLSVKEDILSEELKKIKKESTFTAARENAVPVKADNCFVGPQGRKKIIEEKIMALILKDCSNLDLINDNCLPLFSGKVKKFLEDFKQFAIEQGKHGGNEEDLRKSLSDFSDKYSAGEPDQDFKNFLVALSLRAEVEYDEDAEEEIQLCLSELKSIEVKDKLKAMSEEMKKAENEKDFEKVNNLVQQFDKLTKEL